MIPDQVFFSTPNSPLNTPMGHRGMKRLSASALTSHEWQHRGERSESFFSAAAPTINNIQVQLQWPSPAIFISFLPWKRRRAGASFSELRPEEILYSRLSYLCQGTKNAARFEFCQRLGTDNVVFYLVLSSCLPSTIHGFRGDGTRYLRSIRKLVINFSVNYSVVPSSETRRRSWVYPWTS